MKIWFVTFSVKTSVGAAYAQKAMNVNGSEVWDIIMCPIILKHGLGESCVELSLCYLMLKFQYSTRLKVHTAD